VAEWAAHPHPDEFDYDDEAVRRLWPRLHAGDGEPLPADPAVLRAWTLYHRGAFQRAYDAGLACGPAGATVANRAACIHATYLERDERTQLDLYGEVVRRAEEQSAREPGNAAAHYLLGYALGRHAQAISVAKALAHGLGGARVRVAFETAIRLRPQHADAHIGLGTFHAEVIDKVGALVAGMTYGASREQGLAMFRDGLRLHPQSAIGLVEYANGLLMLAGDEAMDEATGLYERAAAITPLDAAQRLDVTLAQLELQDG
jgi:tetratricopeptide (TPR) repeat protein